MLLQPGALLVWSGTQLRTEAHHIPSAGLVLGRDLLDTTDDDRVSRRHLRIEIRDGCVCAKDLGSRNGSYVNGHALVDREVTQGLPVVVRTGRTVWVIVDDLWAHADALITWSGMQGPERAIVAAATEQCNVVLRGSLVVARQLAIAYSSQISQPLVRFGRARSLASILAANVRALELELDRPLTTDEVATLGRWLETDPLVLTLVEDRRCFDVLPRAIRERLGARTIDIPVPGFAELPAAFLHLIARLAPGAEIHATAIEALLVRAFDVPADRVLAAVERALPHWRARGLGRLRGEDLDLSSDVDLERCVVIPPIGQRPRRPAVDRQPVRREPQREETGTWMARRLCPDGSCIGLIGANNACNVCGKPVPLEDPYR